MPSFNSLKNKFINSFYFHQWSLMIDISHDFSTNFSSLNGADKVWKGLKTSFLQQNMWNPNGDDKGWKARKTSFLQNL